MRGTPAGTPDAMQRSMKILCSFLIAAGLFLASRAALADEVGLLSRHGFGMSIGAGVTGFVDEDMREATDPGGTWDVRVAGGTRLPVTVELAYVGSAQAIDAIGLDPDAILFGNGFEGAARLNLLAGAARPYFVVGAGWTRYELTNAETNTSSVNGRDDVLTLPIGAGVSYRFDPLVLDARVVVRPTFDNELLPDSSAPGNPTRLDSASLLVRGGFEF